MRQLAVLGSGFISEFYVSSIHRHRNKDRVIMVQSRTEEKVRKFAEKHDIQHWTTDMEEAAFHPDVEIIVIALPNNLHLDAVRLAVEAGKGVLCTKPLGRTGKEALEMLQLVEEAGVFHGYLEDLVYAPKALRAAESIQRGALGRILWARSRETHPGPHSDWFWDAETAGGGAIIDLGCHCIELGRTYIGKNVKPLEVMCWADTQVKPIEAEDHAIGLVKYEGGAIGQFEVSWAFRGGLDLRDEIMGTEGTIWINHFLRTGLEMFTTVGQGDYVAEKAEITTGWLFPVADEYQELGYNHMFADMFDAFEEKRAPEETFYDGYVVNAIMDAAYTSAKSKKWEKINLKVWRGNQGSGATDKDYKNYDHEYYLIKEEALPNGEKVVILKNKKTGSIIQKQL